MKTIQIIKRNRKYFAAKLENKYPCKLLIDANSEALEPGEYTLDLDDISVRSKYGTDLIFKLSAPADQQQEAGICTLRADYNSVLVSRCHELGGKWDAEEKAWIFSGLVAEEVEALDEIYNSPLVAIEIKAKEDTSAPCGPLEFCGYVLARAYGRDSGATLAEGVSCIEGHVTSGGSHKNWDTKAKAGTVLRLYIPEQVLAEYAASEESWEIKYI